MSKRKVGTNASAVSIANDEGFFWETVWNHGENAALREKRKDPTVLHEDDEIFIPEKRIKEVSKATESQHVFKRKGTPAKIRLQLFKNGEPRQNENYIIEIDGTQTNGTTDGEGKLEHFVSPSARSGRVILRNGREMIPLRIGALDPLDKLSGIRQRLNNLGFNCGSSDSEELDEQTREALKKFQADNGIEVTGESDGATKEKLKEMTK